MGGRPSFPIIPVNDRQIIVTGGNTGLGYEIAKWTAMMGADVVIACRSEQRAQEAIERMNTEYKALQNNLKDKHNIPVKETLAVQYMQLDLNSFQSTLDFVEQYKKSNRKLHVLILNAGIGMVNYEKTADGFEKMLQVNYLGHFVITAKLLPVMRTSGEDCRLLLMSSDAHRTCTFDMDTMNFDGNPNKFGRLDYYGRSKLYQIMQMYCMIRRLKGTNISVNSCHPGIVDTEINRGFKDSFFWGTIFAGGAKVFGKMKTPLEGAMSLINAAVNPDLVGVNGIYYYDCKTGSTTSDARNLDKQETLWRKTLELLKDYITPEEMASLEGTGTS